MDHDFYIELVARHGLEPLEPFLGEMPFEILLRPDLDSSAVALVQGAVSEFAGFGAAAPVRGDRHFYETSIRGSAVDNPGDVIRALSSAFNRASMPHWIWRVEHDWDKDELVVNEGCDLLPASHAGTERWAERVDEDRQSGDRL